MTLNAGTVVLDGGDNGGGRSRLYETPLAIVRCDSADQLDRAFAEIEAHRNAGRHLAGFFAYELGYLLEPRLRPLLPENREVPLIWLGVFDTYRDLDPNVADDWIAATGDGAYQLTGMHLSQSRSDYLTAIATIKEFINAGDVYQINHTLKYLFRFEGDPLALYAALRRRQPVHHGCFISAPEFDLLSLSPELFLDLRNGGIQTRPMKGTAARGDTPEQDDERRRWLAIDEKSRAENLMIVDLMRNDISRIAEIGSVRVSDLFAIETYPTLHQMTSRIEAKLEGPIDIARLLGSVFPCGSITGAPKVRAMEIIRDLEDGPRGAYTGAVGMIAPDGSVRLNVAIRTLLIDRHGNGEIGIGGGIVADSNAEAEYDECLLKARFVTDVETPFGLIETLLWEPDKGYALLDRHLARLAASAAYFGFVHDIDVVRTALDLDAANASLGLDAANASLGLDATGEARKVRLVLARNGEPEVTTEPIAAPRQSMTFAFSERPVDYGDIMLRHKTTRRSFFEAELARMRAATGCDEVLFANQRGEVTEGSYTSLFIERGGLLLTPPLSCGLLDGVLRREMIEDPSIDLRERVLFAEDIKTADRVWLGNSVRGLVPATTA